MNRMSALMALMAVRTGSAAAGRDAEQNGQQKDHGLCRSPG
jgi:hypothetical protein